VSLLPDGDIRRDREARHRAPQRRIIIDECTIQYQLRRIARCHARVIRINQVAEIHPDIRSGHTRRTADAQCIVDASNPDLVGEWRRRDRQDNCRIIRRIRHNERFQYLVHIQALQAFQHRHRNISELHLQSIRVASERHQFAGLELSAGHLQHAARCRPRIRGVESVHMPKRPAVSVRKRQPERVRKRPCHLVLIEQGAR